MDQPTLADLEYQGKKRKTRWELFLGRMDALIPGQLLEDRIPPFYHKQEGEDIPTCCPSCLVSTASSSSTISADWAWGTCSASRSRCGSSWG